MAFSWNIPAAADYVFTTNPDDMLVAINAAFVANSGGGSASWEVALYNSSSPKYIILRRKSLAAGRIIIFGQNGSTPNAAAVTGSASASVLYVGYSASSTVNTADASYLSGAPLAASDYMPGLRCSPQAAATWRVNYAEFADGVVILLSNTSNGVSAFGAGSLIEDLTATAVPTVWGSGSGGGTAWATTQTNSGAILPASVGSSASYAPSEAGLLIRQSSANKICYRAFALGTSVAAKLNNPSATSCLFFPIYLVYHSSDATLNVVGKMRQVGFGPLCDRETTRTGGGVTAYGHQNTTGGSPTQPGLWFVNADI
jgi:hypothetical protein